MPMYRLNGDIFIQSTGESASYEVEIEADNLPSELDVLDFLMTTGDIQIIPQFWEEVNE